MGRGLSGYLSITLGNMSTTVLARTAIIVTVSLPKVYGQNNFNDTLFLGKSANPCASNNGGCSHFCFPTPNGGRKCGCPPGYKLPEAQWNGLLGFVGSSGQTKCEGLQTVRLVVY